MVRYYIKGDRPDGNVCIFDGCHNPYDISVDNPPRDFSYNDINDAIGKMKSIKNPYVQIEWSIITTEEFVSLRLKWCKEYIENYK